MRCPAGYKDQQIFYSIPLKGDHHPNAYRLIIQYILKPTQTFDIFCFVDIQYDHQPSESQADNSNLKPSFAQVLHHEANLRVW